MSVLVKQELVKDLQFCSSYVNNQTVFEKLLEWKIIYKGNLIAVRLITNFRGMQHNLNPTYIHVVTDMKSPSPDIRPLRQLFTALS